MKPVIALRPAEASAATVAAGQALGIEVAAFPLWQVAREDWQAPDPSAIDALLIGSGNALLHAGEKLALYRGKPVHAVGVRTAEIARELGFAVASAGSGGLQQVLEALPPDPVRLLRLAGVERIALTPPPQVEIVARVVYRMEPQPMPRELVERLAAGALVLLHSAAAARHFAAQCDACGLARGGIVLAALGPRIAEAAGPGWERVESAPQPNDAALLALAKELR